MLFLAVSFTFTANNRYFCNIFYPLWRKSTLHFAPAWAADGAARPHFNPTNENSTSPLGAFVLRHGALVRYAYRAGANPRTASCRPPHRAQSDDGFGATHGTPTRQLAPRSRQFGGAATRNAPTQGRCRRTLSCAPREIDNQWTRFNDQPRHRLRRTLASSALGGVQIRHGNAPHPRKAKR